MVQMTDSEGDALPTDGSPRCFDIDLCDFNEGEGPELCMGIPMGFITFKGEQYNGAGVLTVPLRDVLEEYLERIYGTDGGHGKEAFVAYLRDYAARLEAEENVHGYI